jgi:octaprenyl-diphosphate synthase
VKGLKEQILESVRRDLVEIEAALADNLKPYLPLVSHVAKYIMFSGGKRIRPLLMVLSARLCGYEGNYDKTLSVVFEYLHAATLLHDDLVDGADMRRGNPVAHSIWGNPATVLVGDFLLARSIAIAAQTNSIPIMDMLAHTTSQMSEGEIHQLLYRGDLGIDEADYMEVIRRKTASLIQAACKAGALLAEAPGEQVRALADYGYRLGIAFQMADDLLDYTADTRVIGKEIGADLREGKLTLPVIHAMDRATTEDRRRMETIIRDMDITESDFETVLSLIKKYGGIAYTSDRAKEHIKQAKKCLEIFSASKLRTLLEQLADYVLMRKM